MPGSGITLHHGDNHSSYLGVKEAQRQYVQQVCASWHVVKDKRSRLVAEGSDALPAAGAELKDDLSS